MSSYKQFYMRKARGVNEPFSWYFRMVLIGNKEARRERSRFTVQFEVNYEEGPRLLYLGANRFFEGLYTGRKQHGMDGWWNLYLRNEHKRVFIAL